MANRVITIGTTSKPKTPLEVYRDIAMESTPNLSYNTFHKPNVNDYYSLLYTEEELNTISGICADPKNDESSAISAIMTMTQLHYADAYAAWDMFKNRSRYKVDKLVNAKAVQNALHHVFTWIPGERILNPEYGSNLQRYLYEGITDFNVEKIISEIQHAVNTYEPRVKIIGVKNMSTIDDTENNTIRLQIEYVIPSLSPEQYSYTFIYHKQ